MLPEKIIGSVSIKFGKPIRYPKDCEALAAVISDECGENVSSSTIKRLFGFVKNVEQPRLYTLDIIAKYIGHSSWAELTGNSETQNSGFFSIQQIESKQLKIGDQIEVGYSPERVVTFEFIGKNNYSILTSEKSKLKTGDFVKIDHFTIGFPLILSELKRDGKILGQYIAGKQKGLDYVKQIK